MTENKKDIRVEMFRIVGDMAPLIKVDYMDNNAEEHSGLFLLDSGSNDNFLCANMAGCIGNHSKVEGQTGHVYTINGDYMSVDYVRFSFAFGGNQFHDVFGMSDVCLPEIAGDLQIIGILGQEFMLKHQLVIDYSNFTIHTSDVSPKNLSISDCDFFTPMNVGLKYYNMPLVSMYQNGKEIMVLADTGASYNVLSSQAIKDYGFECQLAERIETITGLAGGVEMKEAMVNFHLLTMKGDRVVGIFHHDLFKVSPHYIYTPQEGLCDEDGEQLQPVEAIICSPFMAKEGWVLDFGAKIIYKRRKTESLKEAV